MAGSSHPDVSPPPACQQDPEEREEGGEGGQRERLDPRLLFFPSRVLFFPSGPARWNHTLGLRMQNYAVVINRGCYALDVAPAR